MATLVINIRNLENIIFIFKKLTTDTALDSGSPATPHLFWFTFFGCLILSQRFYVFNRENRKIIQSFLRMMGQNLFSIIDGLESLLQLPSSLLVMLHM